MTDKEYRELSEKSEKLAQNKLYEEYINYVYKIVYNKLRSCASNEDIEECVSDVFLAVFLNYHNNEGTDGDLKGYIGTIASRKAINKYHSLMAKSGKTAEEICLLHLSSVEDWCFLYMCFTLDSFTFILFACSIFLISFTVSFGFLSFLVSFISFL